MYLSHFLLIAATILALYELGQIWYIQVVIYPLFAQVGPAEYIAYHGFYASKIPMPVILPGFASFLLPLFLAFVRPEGAPAWLAYANAVCGLAGLIVTVALLIPRHKLLATGGKQAQTIEELVRFNWLRTTSVTGSAACCVLMTMAAFRPV